MDHYNELRDVLAKLVHMNTAGLTHKEIKRLQMAIDLLIEIIGGKYA